jgi:hypothetical protein
MSKKPTEKWIADLQDAMVVLDGLDIDERKRTTLRRACAEALVEAEERQEFDYEHRNSGNLWRLHDIELLEGTLRNAALCRSFSEEQLILGTLVQRLGRPTKTVKKKAIELGHGRKVDYWANRIESA